MDYLLGIDLGSTSLKGIIYDLDGNLIAGGSRKTELYHPDKEHPDWAVWQPEQIWEGTAAAIRDAVAAIDDPKSIKACAVTGMGMDGVPIDAEGNSLYPFISWHDPRTAPQYEWWLENVTVAKTFSIGGNPVWPINSVLRIRWMMEHEPEILGRTDKWLLIEDFLNFKLSGRRVTDYSMASTTALFDQRSLGWSDELIELSGVDRRLLCEVQPSSTPIGEVTADAAKMTGLPEGTPVVLGGHDHLCGALPVGVFRPGTVLNITGTWECVMTPTARPELQPEFPTMGLTVQAHVARGMHTIWGGNVSADMVEWYRDQFGFEAKHKAGQGGGSDWDHLIEAAAASPPGANRVMFLPHISGASCPVVDNNSKGAFVGLTKTATGGDMLRAIFEGLDYQFLDVVQAVETNLGTQLERFIVVGGAVRNEFWMQNKADMVGRPVEVPAVEEASPLGCAMLAGIGAGLYKDTEDAYQHVSKPGKTYEPDPKLTEKYRAGFEIYKQLYPALKTVHHAMS